MIDFSMADGKPEKTTHRFIVTIVMVDDCLLTNNDWFSSGLQQFVRLDL